MSFSNKIRVAARTSPLSRAQVQEVLELLRISHPTIEFDVFYIPTTGDKDLLTSLRMMERTNFFTKEVDEAVLQGIADIGIHSAKDLPELLSEGLTLFHMTKGIDSSDVLVLKDEVSLNDLPLNPIIATSSIRREEAVRELLPNASFIDLRGTIDQRLTKLVSGEADGVVVAEAALIRLKLTHLNRIKIPGETTPGQGKLAIIGRTDDEEMKDLFLSLENSVI